MHKTILRSNTFDSIISAFEYLTTVATLLLVGTSSVYFGAKLIVFWLSTHP